MFSESLCFVVPGSVENPDDEVGLTGRIDSESLGENEYESLYEKHFPSVEETRNRDLRSE